MDIDASRLNAYPAARAKMRTKANAIGFMLTKEPSLQCFHKLK